MASAEDTPAEVTLLLRAAKGGDPGARDALYDAVYAELRRLAETQVRRERGSTWHPTLLVHEAYLRMVAPAGLDTSDRSHFFNTAVTVMRRVLVDHARMRNAAKRGGDAEHLSLHESLDGGDTTDEVLDVLALDQALDELAALDPRKARVVELRFFAALSVDEVAHALEVSRRTVEADWYFSRAWLKKKLQEA